MQDPRCADPSFAQANPGLCPNAARLILKPAYALKEQLQQFTYKAYVLANGLETELTSGVSFQVGSPAVASIGITNGKCTATSPGITAVSASWGGITAYGQLEVVANCALQETDFAFLIDHSASMGQQFSTLYPSKLAFAKEMASQLVDTMNLHKDQVAVWEFSTAGTLQLGLSQDKAAIKAAIAGISQTQNKTNLALPLAKVIADLQAQAAPNKTLVIVLFSDGENKTGGNPIPEAVAFTGQQNVIMVVGCRAWDGGFMLLENIASGGFFINGLSSNQTAVPGWLSGLKSYVCSGDCNPIGDQTIPYAALDYNKFINWDVTAGHVDLIGNGGVPLFDILPGNGMYVDLCGSSPGFSGKLTGKTGKMPTLNSGTGYAVSLFLAGNQREVVEGRQVRVMVTINSVVQVDQTITINDATMPFTKYWYNFTASQTGPAIISIEQTANPGTPFYGTPLDVVSIYNTGNNAVLFLDNFDRENLTYLPPNCQNQNQQIQFGGAGGYSYCYSSGCLDNPLAAQYPDPNPLTDIEPCSATTSGTAGAVAAKTVVVSGNNRLKDSQGNFVTDSQGNRIT